MGISFSIPIDEAMRIADQLRSSGNVTRGRIGVQIAPVGKDVAESMGLVGEQGALVRSVEPGGPADKAGIQPGDIITAVNGNTLARTSDLPRTIGGIQPGTQVNLTLLRNGASKTVSVTVDKAEEEMSARPLMQQRQEEGPASASANALGVGVVELSNAQRSRLGVKGGVLVRDVTSGSRAEQVGLRAGDVILSLGNQPVDSLASFNAAVDKLPTNRSVTILIHRDGMAQYGIIRPR